MWSLLLGTPRTKAAGLGKINSQGGWNGGWGGGNDDDDCGGAGGAAGGPETQLERATRPA